MSFTGLFKREDFERIATRRTESIFAKDYAKELPEMQNQLEGASVAVIGAAGSIGSATCQLLGEFKLRRFVLFDINENNLVEVVRELRSSPLSCLPEDFQALPIALGSREFSDYLENFADFDYVLNFSAMKHVRSEKDVFCLRRMIETNVLSLAELCDKLPNSCQSVFSVSSDKSVNPANLMGASKHLMEQVLWNYSDKFRTTSTRFANVSFSEGSLLQGFLYRLAKHQPLSAPSDIKRFFISHREAAELSLLAALRGEQNDVLVPAARLQLEERKFSDIATDLLQSLGFEAQLCSSDEEARQRAQKMLHSTDSAATKKWPCYFAPSDTSGEKPYEEFVGQTEEVDSQRFEAIDILKAPFSSQDKSKLEDTLGRFDKDLAVKEKTKTDFVDIFKSGVPSLQHIEAQRNLDQKM